MMCPSFDLSLVGYCHSCQHVNADKLSVDARRDRRALVASLRNKLIPTGTTTKFIMRSTISVMALTTAGSTVSLAKGASKKFSTIIPSTPPAASAVASCSARSITALRLPPQRAEVGKGNRWTTPIIGFDVLKVWVKFTKIYLNAPPVLFFPVPRPLENCI